MEFSVSAPLYQRALSYVMSAVKSTSATGKYALVEAGAGKVSVSVIREDFSIQVSLDESKVGDFNMLRVVEPGRAVVEGVPQGKGIQNVSSNGLIHVVFVENKDGAASPAADPLDGDGDGDEADPGVKVLGALKHSVPCAGKQFAFSLQAVEHVLAFDADKGDPRVMVKGADFQRYSAFAQPYAGEPNQSSDWSGALVSLVDDWKTPGQKAVNVVCSNGQQMAISHFTPIKCVKDFKVLIPANVLVAIAKICDPALEVTVSIKAGQPETVYFTQDLCYGSAVVGSVVLRVGASPDKFLADNYVSYVGKISFISCFKAQTAPVLEVFKVLCAFERPRSRMKFDPADPHVMLTKDDKKGRVEDIPIPISDATGAAFELDISSRHFETAAKQADGEWIEFKFTGKVKNPMARVKLDEGREVYFVPFVN